MNFYLMIILITSVVFLIICIFCFLVPKKRSRKRNNFMNFMNFKKKTNSIVYLKYENLIDNEDHYLTWKFNGTNIQNKTEFVPVLLPYKNKQNEFELHIHDLSYLKPFYEKFNLYNKDSRESLKEMIYITSEYNINKEHYLELEKLSDNLFIIKASLWSLKGPYSHLHIDEKNKLYFDEGIQNNVAKFIIEE